MRPPSREISDAGWGPVDLRTAHGAGEILERLWRAARRGRLPGYSPRGAAAFRVDADALPFPYELSAVITEASGVGSNIRLGLRREARIPLIVAAVVAVTIWPGVWLTDSLLGTYWSAYGRWSAAMPWLTYAWYLPLTVAPVPWMWRSMAAKSRVMALESAEKQTAVLLSELEASRVAH